DDSTHTITESSDTGYVTARVKCDNSVLTNAVEQNTTIFQSAQAGTLIVKKVVVNGNGGTKKATDFSFQVNGGDLIPFAKDGDDLHGKNTLTKDAGTYTITEDPNSGEDTTRVNCDNIVMANGADQTCTINNSAKAGPQIVKKVGVNGNGGTKKATDFSFKVNDGSPIAFLQDSDDLHGKNTLTKDAGTYTVTEPSVAGYDTARDNCDNIALDNGGTQTCTITNTAQAGTLIVNKVVNNANGGTGKATDFSFQVNGGPAQSFLPGADDLNGSNPLSVPAGTYTITEPVNDGYAVS